MNNNDSGIIYIATNLETGKQYVGQTKNFKSRLKDHLKNRIKTYFGNSLQIHGIDTFNFVKISYPKEMINYWEQFWVTKLNTIYPNGYNMTTGGEGGYERCEETRLKLSMSKRGKPGPNLGKHFTEEIRKKMGAGRVGEKNHRFGKPGTRGMLGRRHTEEARRKMSEVAVGKIPTEETRRKISIAKRGKHHTEETRRKISEAMIGRFHTEETKQKISVAQTGEKNHMWGKYRSIKAHRKMSEAGRNS